MLTFALRRLLWTVPALVVISIVTFLFLSFVPDPADDPELAERLDASELEAMRRERFLDLPRFMNIAPRDVRERAGEAIVAIEQGGDAAVAGEKELARLGGAALPFVLPRFQELEPDRRVDLALALAPVARRMGFTGSDVTNPGRVVGFWTRFWDDRGVEFRRASVRSAVSRLTRYGSAARATDLLELDTFVLDDVIAEMTPPEDAASVRRARALTEVAAHVTGRDDAIPEGASIEDARAAVARWHAFWSVYRGDFTSDGGLDRMAGSVLETRYGKWAYEAVTERFGRGAPGDRPVLDELSARVPVTLAIVLGALALAYSAAVPLGAIAAVGKRLRLNVAVMLAVLFAYALPTAVIAVLARRAGGSGSFAAMTVLAIGLLAAPTAQARAGMTEALTSDAVRAAMARGASPARTVIVHALRIALLPVGTLATREGPMALGGAFVVERVFNLRGVGEATIAAVSHHDTAWLMAIAMVAALIAAFVAVAGDVAAVVIDPRLRAPILARRGRS